MYVYDVLLSNVAHEELPARMYAVDVASQDDVDVRPDLQLPRWLDVHRPPSGDNLFSLSFRANWNEEKHAYEIAEVRIGAVTEPITGAGLRTIALQKIFSATVRSHVIWPSIEAVEEEGFDDPEGTLLIASRQYAIARACGEAPLKAVAAHIGVSQSTATRMIAKARSRGLVD